MQIGLRITNDLSIADQMTDQTVISGRIRDVLMSGTVNGICSSARCLRGIVLQQRPCMSSLLLRILMLRYCFCLSAEL